MKTKLIKSPYSFAFYTLISKIKFLNKNFSLKFIFKSTYTITYNKTVIWHSNIILINLHNCKIFNTKLR